MATKHSELKKLIKLAKANGAKRLKFDNIEIEFETDGQLPQSGPTSKRQAAATGEPISEDKPPTDEELLYWSSGYDPSENRDRPAGIVASAEG